MTVLTILSSEEIRLFEHPPQFTAEERKRFFTVPKWTEEIIATLQTPVSQVGFLLIRHASMACWEHINLLGEYDFSDERMNTITTFDIPKILGLEMG
jgi:hypothetical protein